MPERDTGVVADSRIELRIGINLGDVIVEDDDLYGDGVDIAARIEALAPGAPQLGGEGKTIEVDETFIGRAGSHDPDSWLWVNGIGWVRKGGDENNWFLRKGGRAQPQHRLSGNPACQRLYSICQSLLALPGEPEPIKFVPFISHS